MDTQTNTNPPFQMDRTSFLVGIGVGASMMWAIMIAVKVLKEAHKSSLD